MTKLQRRAFGVALILLALMIAIWVVSKLPGA